MGLRQRGLVRRRSAARRTAAPPRRPSPRRRRSTGCSRRVGFEFHINYHSAAELLLYGTGWQVSTPTPDDAIYEAMVGDDANPALPGLRPRHLGRAVHHQRRDHRARPQRVRHAGLHARDGDVRDGCESVPDDEWDPADCPSVFSFPDDEELVQAEFEKNIPFAIATAQSALDPDDPVSVVGTHDARLRRRQLRRVVRRPADRRGDRPPLAGPAVDDLPHQRRAGAS